MTSMFQKGDNVRIISTGKIGTVNDVIKRDTDYGYRVTIDGRMTTFQEKYLVLYFDENQLILDSWYDGNLGNINDFLLHQTWYRLKRPIDGNLYSFLASRTIFNPFQFKPLSKFLATGSEERLFIADEVGVGKTIETGIILIELIARGRLDRKSPILIVCPNTLGPKWVKEMRNRFNLNFHLHNSQSLELALKGALQGYIPSEYLWSVVSIQLLRSEKFMRLIETICGTRLDVLWRLVVIDEAHHMRNLGTESNELGNYLSSMVEMMIMLSATPLNLRDSDLFNQMHILNPAMFPDIQTFNALLYPVKSLNRCRRLLQQKSPTVYDNILEEISSIEMGTLGRVIKKHSLIQQLKSDLNERRNLSDFEIAMYDRILVSLSPLDQAFTRTLKREAIEHRVIRESVKVGVELRHDEMQFYNDVINLTSDVYIMKGGNSKAIGFITNTPRRMAASCIPAMSDYLEWCISNNMMLIDEDEYDAAEDDSELNKVELSSDLRERYSELYKRAQLIKENDSKYNQFSLLLKQLIGSLENQQVIIFSFFIRTLKYLKQRLEKEGYQVGLICGEMPLETQGEKIGRYNVMEQFEKKELQILLSSEVGGEGLDFQFCQAMINYDLPYNPMRIEQRIGRIDRFGQSADKIIVASMYLKDTIDESIYNVLFERIKLVEDSVGLIEPIIGEKITDLQNCIISGILNEEQLKKRVEEIEISIQQAKLEMELFENNRKELMGDDYFNKTIMNLQSTDFVTPEDTMLLTELCLSSWNNCGFTRVDEYKGIIILSKEVKIKLQTFMRRPGSEGSSYELDILSVSKTDVLAVFSGNIAVTNPQVHFLSPCGFWTKFLLYELELEGRIKRVFVASAEFIEIGLEPSDYIIPIFELKIEGFRTELKLAAVPISISNREYVDCDFIKLSRDISRYIFDLDDDLKLDIDPNDYIDLATEAVEKQLEDNMRIMREENIFRVEARKNSLLEGSKVRCSRLRKKLEDHIIKCKQEAKNPSQEFIRLTEAQITNDELNAIERIKKIENKVELSLTTSLISILYLNVR
jgi:superfamily II DNA or RNA helicase